MSETVGIVGLGIMGMSYARLLLAAGHKLVGFDIVDGNLDQLADEGGTAKASAAEVAQAASVVLTALPSEPALFSAYLGPNGLKHGAGIHSVFVEMSTLGGEAKRKCRDELAEAGATMLDCPVSGTGAQAKRGEIDILASGDEAAIDRLKPLFATFSKGTYYVGEFGAGMKLKLIANLLVTVHNLAAAEALLLAERAGLDLNVVHAALRTGAGTSRMFEVRGPLMIEGRYVPPTAKMEVHNKDIGLIADFAASVRSPTPLLAASTPYYQAALAQGRHDEDTAALFAVLQSLTTPGR